jgi:hypothetical protein
LPRADQRARGSARERDGGREEQLAEPGDEVGRSPGDPSDAADKPSDRTSVRVPPRHRPREAPQQTETGGMLATREDTHGPDHLIQAAEGTGQS